MALFASIKWKVAALMISLVLGTVCLTGWVFNRTFERQFKEYLYRSHQEEVENLLSNLGEVYQNNNGWHTLATTVVGRRWLINTPIVKLEDAKGNIVFSRGRMVRMHALDNRRIGEYPVIVNDRLVGRVQILGTTPAGFLTQTDLAFGKAINHATVLSSIILCILALFLGFLGVRPFTLRLNLLHQAVSSLTAGDLRTRVPIDSQDELGALAKNFNLMADKLGELEEVRKKYLSETAHELRTPLTTIRSHIEAFIDGVIPPDQEGLLRVEEEVMNLISLINNLQDLASFTGLHKKISLVPLELNAFLRDLIEKFQPVATKEGIGITLHLPPESLMIKADPEALTKILNNLLMNALKFSASGDSVSVTLNQTESQVKVAVSDEGIGIPPTDLEKIFDRFYRVDPSRSRKTGGVGLGLAIVKELTTELGGQVEVSSQLHQGTTFTLTFPAHR